MYDSKPPAECVSDMGVLGIHVSRAQKVKRICLSANDFKFKSLQFVAKRLCEE